MEPTNFHLIERLTDVQRLVLHYYYLSARVVTGAQRAPLRYFPFLDEVSTSVLIDLESLPSDESYEIDCTLICEGVSIIACILALFSPGAEKRTAELRDYLELDIFKQWPAIQELATAVCTGNSNISAMSERVRAEHILGYYSYWTGLYDS